MELLPLVVVLAWASGVNAPASLVILGLLGRFAAVDPVPAGFQRTDVLIIVAIAAAVELVIDKFTPWDSVWDVVNTIGRPVAGGFVGALLGAAHGVGPAVGLAALGVVVSLLTHAVKVSLRLALTRPSRPGRTIVLSVAEDVAALVAVSAAFLVPIPALITVVVLVLVGAAAALLLRQQIRGSLQRFHKLGARIGELQPDKKPPLADRLRTKAVRAAAKASQTANRFRS